MSFEVVSKVSKNLLKFIMRFL